MNATEKLTVCKRFAMGENVADIAARYGAHRLTIEGVIRLAFNGLAKLNHDQGFTKPEPLEPIVIIHETDSV